MPVFSWDGKDYYRCPIRVLEKEVSPLFLKLYQHYRRGFLPYSGGLLEQPYLYVSAMEIIASKIAELEKLDAAKSDARRTQTSGLGRR